MTTTRSPEDVFAHHAQALMAGDVEEIISDYSDDAILIVGSKVSRGRDGARDVFTQLLQEAPQATWEVEPVFTEDVLYLEWRARSGSRQLDGIDTFIFRDGRIRVQTVRYTVQGDYPDKRRDDIRDRSRQGDTSNQPRNSDQRTEPRGRRATRTDRYGNTDHGEVPPDPTSGPRGR